jgi:hypothetical protein
MSEQTEHEHETEGDAPAEDETHADFEGSPEADDSDAPEPEPEPQEASAPASEKEIEKALRAVERAGTTYRNAVDRALREDAQALLPCPRCNAPVAGMIFPPELAPVDDETRASVLASIGEDTEAAPPLREAEGVVMCARCDGWGELTFPTRREHTKKQSCPACNGSGYTLAPEPASNVSPIVTTTATTSSANVNVIPSCDRCGQPGMQGQPHWCVPAVSVGA